MEHDTFFQSASFEDILDDLSCRFIVNIPSEELESVARICFQIEQAHWFYEDFVREQNPHRLPSLSLRKFSKCIFDHCPLLWQYSGSHEEEFEDFLRYKQRVPVLGGILLDENWDKCILVKAWKGGSWSFPRGKINKDEPDTDCAIREVYEETGYDISPLILPDAFLELQIKEQRVKLYIIPGVPTNTLMSPQTRKEISNIGWIRLVDLPGYSKRNKQTHPGIKLYMVTPFLSGLRKWISTNRHMKGKLVPVEEGLEEDMIKDDVVQNGTTDELIAMLRRQQQQQQQQDQPGVDLLGMLRNGSQMSPPPSSQEQFYPPPPRPSGGFTYTFQENPLRLSDLLQLSPPLEPVLEVPQDTQSSQPIVSQAPIIPTDKGRNSLLSILKGGPSNTVPEPEPVNVSLLDLLKGQQSPPTESTTQTSNSAKVEHQQSLLSAFKSPQLSSTVPTTTSKPVTAHQNALLTALTSPPLPRATPPLSHPAAMAPTAKSPPAKPVQPSAHQNVLLASLNKPKPTPPPTSVQPSELASPNKSPIPDSGKQTVHQNALLSALKSPTAKPSQPPTNHQVSLLTALKSPTLQSPSAVPPSYSPPSVPSSAIAQPTEINPSPFLLGLKSPPLPRSTPPPAHQISIQSAAKSPPSPSRSDHQSSLLNVLKSSTPAHDKHASSLLSALKNSKPGSPVEKKIDGSASKGDEIKNIHMESLLRNLTSPSSSPVVGKTVPPSITEKSTKIVEPVDDEVISAPAIRDNANTAEKVVTEPAPASDHISSLLSSLKGSGSKSPSPAPTVPASQNSLLSALLGSKTTASVQQVPVKSKLSLLPRPLSSKPQSPSPSVVESKPSVATTSNKPVPGTPQNPKTNGTVSIPVKSPPAQTTHQQSLLSLLSPKLPPVRTQSPSKAPHTPARIQSPSKPTQSPTRKESPSKPSSRPTRTQSPAKPTSKGQQFNFSASPQMGKRTKFRDVLVPGGKQDVPVEPQNSNGTIDLRKVTLLKRPEPTTGNTTQSIEPATENTTITHPDQDVVISEENSATIHTDQGEITVLKRPEMRRTESMENGPESPLGIEFPFRKRTPSKSSRASPTPTPTPTKMTVRSLLPLLKAPTDVAKENDVSETVDDDVPVLKEELKEVIPKSEEKGKSLLDVLKSAPKEEPEEVVSAAEREEIERLGTEREKKLLAMLERALARGVPS